MGGRDRNIQNIGWHFFSTSGKRERCKLPCLAEAGVTYTPLYEVAHRPLGRLQGCPACSPGARGAPSPGVRVAVGGCCPQHGSPAQSANSNCNSHQNSLSLMHTGTPITRDSMKITPGEIRRNFYQWVDGGWKNSWLFGKGNVKSRVWQRPAGAVTCEILCLTSNRPLIPLIQTQNDSAALRVVARLELTYDAQLPAHPARPSHSVKDV